MDIDPATPRASSGFTSGVRTAVVVVVLGTLAAVADHAFFVAPYAVAPAVASEQAAPATLAGDDGLPAGLRPTAADVTPPPPTF